MASLAEKRKADAEERSTDPQARPEELRLLEALFFASSEPLDQATLAKRTPGRPLTFGTTEAFLSQFSLEALSDLPGLEELKGTGLLDSRLPSGFSVPTPSDDPALRDDEDPLEIGDLELALAPAAEPENGS